MSFNRRDFLQISSLIIASSVAQVSGAFEGDSLGSGALAIMQGATDDKSTYIQVLNDMEEKLTVRARAANGSNLSVSQVDQFKIPGQDEKLCTFYISGMKPETDYFFEVLDRNGSRIDYRVFTALNISKKTCRLGVVSCMNAHFLAPALFDKATPWQMIQRQKPDMVFLIGDSVYVDYPFVGSQGTEELLAQRHLHARNNTYLFRLERLIPIVAVWDDHDYGCNNQDKTYALAAHSQLLFSKFFSTKYNNIHKKGLGVGSVLDIFNQRFIFMDDRRFRDPQGTTNARYWGDQQTEWMLQQVSSAKKPTWLINGNQFFGGYLGKESYEGNYNADFANTIMKLSKLSTPIAFVSGDVHFSELMRIESAILGYTTYEITSSRLYSSMAMSRNIDKNPRRLVDGRPCVSKNNNFVILDVDVSQGWKIKAKSHLRRYGAQIVAKEMVINPAKTDGSELISYGSFC